MFGKRKKQERKIGSAFDRLLNYTFKKDEDMNTQLLDLADIVTIIDRYSLILKKLQVLVR